MLICHCKRVNDRTIKSAIDDGARSIEAVGRHCGAGTGCGGCRPAIDHLLRDSKRTALPLLTAAIVAPF
ncbi:MAG: (2Fe-2S)-binding protein [Myxococcota bacterium]